MFKSLKIAICGYKSDQVGCWDPDDCLKGLPGSEEAVVYASQSLEKLGHSVTVMMNPPKNTKYKNWVSVDVEPKGFDMVILWRRYDCERYKIHNKYVFGWFHDSPRPYGLFSQFDGVFILSEHHRAQFLQWQGFDRIPYTICGNGVVLEQFDKPIGYDNVYSIGYFSNYARGLMNLIKIWPNIRRAFPKATLGICYGRIHWGCLNEQDFNFLIGKIEQYKNLGVTEFGKIGHQELANIMQRTSIFAYPCNEQGYSETWCITAVKCQLAGMIPVTTRIGALDETIHKEAPSIRRIDNLNDLDNYETLLKKTLIRAALTDTKEERKKYIEFARQYTWERCVKKWISLYEEIKKD